MFFTMFVVLPSEDVCTLRRLPSPSSIRAVRKMLEVSAGLPAQTYDLACPDGERLADDSLLQLDSNVWDGYLMRAVFRETWRALYEAVLANDVEEVLKHALHEEDDGKERGVVALFMASFLGLAGLCKALLYVGVDPDGQTPFGRTPLFAAMAGNHAHVTELLLSHHASLEARDTEDTSAVDVALEQQANECLRKVRQLKLFSRSSSATSSRTSRTSARGSDHSGSVKSHHRVIKIPTGAAGEADATNDRTETRPVISGEDNTHSPVRVESTPRPQEPTFTNGLSKTLETSTGGGGGSRPSPRTLFQHSEVYTWENNLRSISRASSAAGTQVRIPVPGSGRERVSSGRSSRASNGVTWSDTVSVTSGGNRRPSLRLSVQDFSIASVNPVLKVSHPASSPHAAHPAERKPATSEVDQSLGKHDVKQGPVPDSLPVSREANEPHVPSWDPPERPPSPVDALQMSREEAENQAVAGSIQIVVPDLQPRGKADCGTAPGSSGQESVGEKGKGHVDAARDNRPRSSTETRSGPRLAKSRRKQEASWRAMKRRLKLAEDQKRNTAPKTKTKQSDDKETRKTSFEQWLQRKRREKERPQDSSEADSSSEGVDEQERSAENDRAFNDWLRELKERPLRAPHPFTPASLHRRKSRPLKNLIQVGNMEDAAPAPDPDTYMTAYKEWRRAKNSTDPEEQLTSPQDLMEARKRMEEKRKSLLAVALTYEEWLELSEQRQKVMQALLRKESDKLAHKEQATRRAPHQISFQEWRERVEKREAEIRHGGKAPAETSHVNDYGFLVHDDIRSSAAIPHEEWLKRKKEEMEKSKKNIKATGNCCPKTGPTVTNKHDTSKMKTQEQTSSADVRNNASVAVSEDGKESAWELWLQRKHQNEMEQLAKYKGKELLLNLQQNETSRVTQY